MTNPIPQDPTVFGASGNWASGDLLVDELREEYAQVEADQDCTPSEAGFIAFLARRIARVDAVRAKVRSKEHLGGAAALRAEEARQPERARNDDDEFWLHDCGQVGYGPACTYCGESDGGWQALYVLTDHPVAPEHTGVSDVQAEALDGLREELSSVRGVNEALAGSLGKLARGADLVLDEVDAIRQEYVLGKAMAARLDRIESLLRGEQR